MLIKYCPSLIRCLIVHCICECIISPSNIQKHHWNSLDLCCSWGNLFWYGMDLKPWSDKSNCAVWLAATATACSLPSCGQHHHLCVPVSPTGNYHRALQCYKEIHKRFPENTDCLKFLVRLCTDLGLKEVQEYSLKLRKAEKAREAKRQVCKVRWASTILLHSSSR